MEGYRFLGWAYDEDRLEPVQTETITLDKMYTKLYADWFKIPPVVDTPEPEPQPESDPEPVVVEKEIPWLYIIIAAGALVVIAIVVVVIIVVSKKKKS
jgi:hypothetical protein